LRRNVAENSRGAGLWFDDVRVPALRGALAHTLGHHGERKEVFNSPGCNSRRRPGILKLGWVARPAYGDNARDGHVCRHMIFIYSVGYMAHDENFTRFFTFLSLFAARCSASSSRIVLLLLFICWNRRPHIVSTHRLLYHKPSAAARQKGIHHHAHW